MFKFLGVLAALGAVVALGLVIETQSQPPTRADYERDPSVHVAAPGQVEGVSPAAELRFEIAGRVVEILVQEGQQVAAGQVLVRLDDELARHNADLAASQVEIAEAELERLLNGARLEEIDEAAAQLKAAEARLSLAQKNWERARTLWEQKTISGQEFDDVHYEAAFRAAEYATAEARLKLLKAPPRGDEVHRAEAQVGAARARQKRAVAEQERSQLRAPINGKILRINPEVGEMAGPDSPEPAVVMADTSKLFVRAFVDELDAPRVRPGMRATITADGLLGQQCTGRVTRVSPHMSEKQLHTNRPTERVDTKVRELWIELDPLPGSGLADFVIGLRVDVLIEPNSTVARPSSPISELGQVPPASTSNRPTRNRRESAPFLDPAGTELKAGRDENAAGSLGSSSVDLVSTPLLPPSTRSPRP